MAKLITRINKTVEKSLEGGDLEKRIKDVLDTLSHPEVELNNVTLTEIDINVFKKEMADTNGRIDGESQYIVITNEKLVESCTTVVDDSMVNSVTIDLSKLSVKIIKGKLRISADMILCFDRFLA